MDSGIEARGKERAVLDNNHDGYDKNQQATISDAAKANAKRSEMWLVADEWGHLAPSRSDELGPG